MRRSLSIVIMLSIVALLSGCIITTSPKDNPVVLLPGQAKTFTINVFPHPAKYAWFVSGNVVPGATGNSFSYMIDDVLLPLNFTIEVTATGLLGIDKYTWNVHYVGTNKPPIAEAGPNQNAGVGATVTLDGSGSTDPDNNIVSYHWVQTGGPPVTLSDPNAIKPQFVANVPLGSTVYFQVAEFQLPYYRNDSYVLPLSDPQDIAYARGLIGTGPPIGFSRIVVADIEAGSDGINRDFRAPGAPLWSWHVIEFIGFADYTAEILDGCPTYIEQEYKEKPPGTRGSIGFWSYTVVAELDPSLFPVPIPSSFLTFELTVTDAGNLVSHDTCVVKIIDNIWGMFRHDRQHTGRSPYVGTQTANQKWAFQTGGWVVSSPAIGADGTVYVGSEDGKVYALDGTTGTQKWAFTTGGIVDSSPAVDVDGTVYVGSYDHKFYALDGADGSQKWSFTTGDWMISSPAIGIDGTIYVGCWDGKVYALDGATGTQKWAFSTGVDVHSSPAIGVDGTVYVGSMNHGSGNGTVYALDGSTGNPKWAFATGGMIGSSPAVGADGTVYVGCHNGNVYALDGATGTQKWVFTIGGEIWSCPAIGSDGTVYIGSWNDGKIYALDGATGGLKWAFTTGDWVYSSPGIGADGTVYVGSFDHKVYAIDSATGAPKWAFTTGDWVYSSPAIGTDGTVYIGSNDGRVYAIGE